MCKIYGQSVFGNLSIKAQVKKGRHTIKKKKIGKQKKHHSSEG